MRISDWSSDVCSSDLPGIRHPAPAFAAEGIRRHDLSGRRRDRGHCIGDRRILCGPAWRHLIVGAGHRAEGRGDGPRSEEHTSELQSLMRISYAVFCLKKKTPTHNSTYPFHSTLSIK